MNTFVDSIINERQLKVHHSIYLCLETFVLGWAKKVIIMDDAHDPYKVDVDAMG